MLNTGVAAFESLEVKAAHGVEGRARVAAGSGGAEGAGGVGEGVMGQGGWEEG